MAFIFFKALWEKNANIKKKPQAIKKLLLNSMFFNCLKAMSWKKFLNHSPLMLFELSK